MARPVPVTRAGMLYLAAVAVQPVLTALVWTDSVAAYGAALAAGDLAFTVGVWLLLVLLACGRGSNGARWVLLVLTGLTVAYRLWQVSRFGIAGGAASLLLALQTLLLAAGAVQLLLPDAREWFAADEEDGA